MTRATKVRLLKKLALIAIAVAAIYAFSPAAQNQFGSVKPRAERTARADNVRATTLDGANWSLAAQSGKVVLLNFWATWCPPCRVETPALVALHNKYAAQGFTVAGISMDDDPRGAVPSFAQRYGIPYPLLVPSPDLEKINQVESLPTSILIDRSGRIARTYRGMVTETGLRDDIESLLAEHKGVK